MIFKNYFDFAEKYAFFNQKDHLLEKFFENVYLASHTTDEETKNRWEVVFRELNTKEELNLGNRQFSSYSMTVQSKRNSSLKKYLEFILEEFYKVL